MCERRCGQFATDESFSGSGEILVRQRYETPSTGRRGPIVAHRTGAVDDYIGRRKFQAANKYRWLGWICRQDNTVQLRVERGVRDPRQGFLAAMNRQPMKVDTRQLSAELAARGNDSLRLCAAEGRMIGIEVGKCQNGTDGHIKSPTCVV